MALSISQLVHLLTPQRSPQVVVQAHPAVQHLSHGDAVNLHQLLMTHPGVQQHLRVQQQHDPTNLGVPGPVGMPQSGFGMQVQNLGGLPFHPYYQGGLQNQGPQNLGHFNPQLHDTGYFWNQ